MKNIHLLTLVDFWAFYAPQFDADHSYIKARNTHKLVQEMLGLPFEIHITLDAGFYLRDDKGKACILSLINLCMSFDKTKRTPTQIVGFWSKVNGASSKRHLCVFQDHVLKVVHILTRPEGLYYD